MFGIRLVGTNKWIVRTPGHSKVVEDAGSTWTSPPKNLENLWNGYVHDHVCDVENLPYNSNNLDALIKFETSPEKYLEIVKVKFVDNV